MTKTPYIETEHAIQAAIQEYLLYRGFWVWRQNSGMARIKGAGGKDRMIKLGAVGMPDLMAVKKGKLYGFEIKRPGKKTTDIQERTHQELRDHGALIMVARSIEDVKDFLAEDY